MEADRLLRRDYAGQRAEDQEPAEGFKPCFQEMDARYLASESLRFPIVALLSSFCNKMDGMTVLCKYVLEIFHEEHNFGAGIFVQTSFDDIHILANLGILVDDEVALKQSVESKGATGIIFYMRCSNIIKYINSAVGYNDDLIPSTYTDAAKFRLPTNETNRIPS